MQLKCLLCERVWNDSQLLILTVLKLCKVMVIREKHSTVLFIVILALFAMNG